MAITAFYIKQGDSLPVLEADLLNEDDTAINLTTAVSVAFSMRSISGTVKVSAGACTVTSASAGTVTYAWDADDTDTAGHYHAEFEITWPDSKKQTVPAAGYFDVFVKDDLA